MENVNILKVNSVKCLACNTELFSRHRHDFTTCHCENKTFTDGGLDYQRVSGVNLDLVEITSEYEEITKMKELTMELYFYNGETKDSTIEFKSVGNAITEIESFLEDFYNEGYSECDLSYYEITPEVIDRLLKDEYVRLNSTLSLWLNEVENV